MKTTEKEKLASNFELNIMKLGIHTFQLHKGDRFDSNGSYFNYNPSTSENLAKLPYQHYHKTTSISAKKYMKDVLRADNIKLIVDKPYYPEDDPRYNDPNARIREWIVEYAYTQEQPKNDQLLIITLSNQPKDYGKKAGSYVFNAVELNVKRNTAENLFLDQSHPVTYHTQIPKKDLKQVFHHYDNSYIMGYMDDYNELELILFKAVKELIEKRISSAEEVLKREKSNLESFEAFKIANHGY